MSTRYAANLLIWETKKGKAGFTSWYNLSLSLHSRVFDTSSKLCIFFRCSVVVVYFRKYTPVTSLDCMTFSPTNGEESIWSIRGYNSEYSIFTRILSPYKHHILSVWQKINTGQRCQKYRQQPSSTKVLCAHRKICFSKAVKKEKKIQLTREWCSITGLTGLASSTTECIYTNCGLL